MKRNIPFLIACAFILTGCVGQQPGQQPIGTVENQLAPVEKPSVEISKAHLRLASSAEKVSVGDEFTVQILLGSGQNAVTTISPYLLFDTKKLEVKKVDMTNSKFPVSYHNTIDKTAGVVELSLSPSGEGMSGENNLVATITFKAKAAGSATVTFEQKRTKALIQDNTNIISSTFPILTVVIEK